MKLADGCDSQRSRAGPSNRNLRSIGSISGRARMRNVVKKNLKVVPHFEFAEEIGEPQRDYTYLLSWSLFSV
jgi:hypothetical protein